jgi:hypothetical protein
MRHKQQYFPPASFHIPSLTIIPDLLSDFTTVSACESDGRAYMCANQSPWAVDDTTAYGFAAVKLSGKTESDWCCACYELTFTSGPVLGKKMIVQATNTGGDLGNNHFDIAIPGGGVGIFNACTSQCKFAVRAFYTGSRDTNKDRWCTGQRMGRAIWWYLEQERV